MKKLIAIILIVISFMGVTIVYDKNTGKAVFVEKGAYEIKPFEGYNTCLYVNGSVRIIGIDTTQSGIFYFDNSYITNFQSFRDSLMDGNIIITNDELREKDGSAYNGN